jgi:hypothetical protein
MVERKHFDGDEFRGTRVRVLGTNQDEPEEGRIFVWSKEGWFERMEGTSGDVAFSHIADSEDELRELLKEDDPSADLFSLGREMRRTVSEEFVEQYRTFLDSPNTTREEVVEEDEDQEFHQHERE